MLLLLVTFSTLTFVSRSTLYNVGPNSRIFAIDPVGEEPVSLKDYIHVKAPEVQQVHDQEPAKVDKKPEADEKVKVLADADTKEIDHKQESHHSKGVLHETHLIDNDGIIPSVKESSEQKDGDKPWQVIYRFRFWLVRDPELENSRKEAQTDSQGYFERMEDYLDGVDMETYKMVSNIMLFFLGAMFFIIGVKLILVMVMRRANRPTIYQLDEENYLLDGDLECEKRSSKF
ncbi:hypothetical protein RF11_07794 [Thelohanellus kitauei]|uniref:Uncharacterized protein n=1 Tax=Thelohanellus kitauei TaxID=669202 RepID=A0A0C2NDN9_THEKT|nr:hypothetical protein RF11_07794 [Thelohanellus kitauei]